MHLFISNFQAIMNVLLSAVLFAVLLYGVHCGPFTVSISAKREYKFGDSIVFYVTITNSHSRDYALLARNTPLEGLKSNIFSVTRDGKMIPYDSILVKRASPAADEYVLIQAKSSVSASVDLSRAYSFESTGEYQVQLKTELQYLNDERGTQKVSSNIEVFSFAESPNHPKLTEGELHRRSTLKAMDLQTGDGPSLAFDGPSTTNTLEDNAWEMYLMAFDEIVKSYSVACENLPLYTKWFGDPKPANVYHVIHAYFEMWCGMYYNTYVLYFWGPLCERNWYAYTYHYTDTVYLCEILWTNTTDTGVDGKVGTLVHELSHAIAETIDIEYGQIACLELAKNNPDNTIINADSYSFFSGEVFTRGDSKFNNELCPVLQPYI